MGSGELSGLGSAEVSGLGEGLGDGLGGGLGDELGGRSGGGDGLGRRGGGGGGGSGGDVVYLTVPAAAYLALATDSSAGGSKKSACRAASLLEIRTSVWTAKTLLELDTGIQLDDTNLSNVRLTVRSVKVGIHWHWQRCLACKSSRPGGWGLYPIIAAARGSALPRIAVRVTVRKVER